MILRSKTLPSEGFGATWMRLPVGERSNAPSSVEPNHSGLLSGGRRPAERAAGRGRPARVRPGRPGSRTSPARGWVARSARPGRCRRSGDRGVRSGRGRGDPRAASGRRASARAHVRPRGVVHRLTDPPRHGLRRSANSDSLARSCRCRRGCVGRAGLPRSLPPARARFGHGNAGRRNPPQGCPGRGGRPRTARLPSGRGPAGRAAGPSAVQVSVTRTARTLSRRLAGPSARVRSMRHWPSILRWECRVQPVSRADQDVLAARTPPRRRSLRPDWRSTTPAQRSSAASSRRPASASCSRAQVPEDGVALGHGYRRSLQPARGEAEPGRRRAPGREVGTRPERSARRPPSPRSACPARPVCNGFGQSRWPPAPAGRGIIAPGEQRASAALDVEHESSVDEDDQGARLASGQVAAGRRLHRECGQASAAPYGLAGSAAASTREGPLADSSSGRAAARSRSTAPTAPNWAAPRPSTK